MEEVLASVLEPSVFSRSIELVARVSKSWTAASVRICGHIFEAWSAG